MYKLDPGGAAPHPPGLITKAPPAAYPAQWAGVYGGLFAGGHWSRNSWNSDETDPAAAFGPFELRLAGFSGGALVGANVQYGNIVWGPELDAGWMTGSATFDARGFESRTIDTLDVNVRWNAHARVRVGYATGEFLPFIAAGVAFANTKVTYHDSTANPNTLPAESFRLTHVGLTAGVGIDWRFARSWIGRVEYLHDKYAPASFSSGQQTNGEFYELRSHTVRGAIVYKWDWSTPLVARY
jgi:outer membrane immunogenic protein